MRIYKEISLADFEGWSGAEDTLNRVYNEGQIDTLESMLEDMYPKGMDETELNDLLRFEAETVFEWLGIRTELQIREELEEAETELESLIQDYQTEVEDLEPEEKEEIYKSDYKVDIDILEDTIAELKEELEGI